MKIKELRQKLRGVSTKLPIFQLRIILYNHTWYNINAMTLYFVVINRYASNLICIFMNINEDIRNKTKNYRKMKGSTNKNSYI